MKRGQSEWLEVRDGRIGRGGLEFFLERRWDNQRMRGLRFDLDGFSRGRSRTQKPFFRATWDKWSYYRGIRLSLAIGTGDRENCGHSMRIRWCAQEDTPLCIGEDSIGLESSPLKRAGDNQWGGGGFTRSRSPPKEKDAQQREDRPACVVHIKGDVSEDWLGKTPDNTVTGPDTEKRLIVDSRPLLCTCLQLNTMNYVPEQPTREEINPVRLLRKVCSLPRRMQLEQHPLMLFSVEDPQTLSGNSNYTMWSFNANMRIRKSNLPNGW